MAGSKLLLLDCQIHGGVQIAPARLPNPADLVLRSKLNTRKETRLNTSDNIISSVYATESVSEI